MSEITFLRAWPRDPVTGAEVAIRLAGGGAYAPYRVAGDDYRAGVVNRPRITAGLGFGREGFSGRVLPSTAPIAFAPSDADLRDQMLRLVWVDARFELDTAPNDAALPVRLLTGDIADMSWQDGIFTLTLADMSKRYDRPLLAPAFTGAGGLEGYAGAAGRPKRRTFGRRRNIEGRLFDPAYSIWEFGDPAYPLQAFTTVRDKGREGGLTILAWQGTAAATLAALKNAAALQGGGVAAPSIACVKWWTSDPSGPITADIEGDVTPNYVSTVAGVADRLIKLAGGAGLTNLGTAIAWRGAIAGVHVDDQGQSYAATVDELLRGASLSWAINADGTSSLRQWSFNDPAGPLQAIFIDRKETLPPSRTRTYVYRTNHRTHNDSEISAAILATDVIYDDGTPIEALKPAQPGADVTGSNVAAAIVGQGLLAGRNDVIFGSHITNLPDAISPGNFFFDGSMKGGMIWNDAGTKNLDIFFPAQIGADRTGSNVAAAVVGQAATATSSDFAVITGSSAPDANATSSANIIQNPMSEEPNPKGLGAQFLNTGNAYHGTKARYVSAGVAGLIARAPAGAGDIFLFDCFTRALSANALRSAPLIRFVDASGNPTMDCGYYWGNTAPAAFPTSRASTAYGRVNVRTLPAPVGTVAIEVYIYGSEALTTDGPLFDNLSCIRLLTFGSHISNLPDAIDPANLLAGGTSINAAFARYGEGETVQSLKPAQPGADVTGSNVAAAIVGQGLLAGRNDVIFGSHITNLPDAISPGNFFFDGSMKGGKIWNDAGTKNLDTFFPAQTGADRTGSNVAAAVVGQAATATSSDFAAITGSTKPQANADVTALAQVTIVPPPPQIIRRTWQGTPKPTEFPRYLTPGVTRGGTDIRTSPTVSYAISTSGVTATVSNANDATRGRITVTAGGAGSISLTVTVSGVAYGPFVVPFTVEDDPAPTNQGANGGTDPTLASVPSTAFVQMTSVDASEDILTATIAAGQSLVGTAPLTYDFQPNTNASDSAVLVARWQYRTAGSGGSWLDFVANTSIAGSAAHWFANDFSGSPGSGQFNQTKAGLAAGTYECRLVGALQTYADGSIVISQGAATLSVA